MYRPGWRSTSMSRLPMPSTIRASRTSSIPCSIAWRARRDPQSSRDRAMARRGRIGEFELIARYFAPLARGFAGAGGLLSDNAVLPAGSRHGLVGKTGTGGSGVHLLADQR